MIPVSVVAIQPNTVTRLRTPERDGYAAIQLGTEPGKKLTRPETGQLGNLPKVAVIREFRSRISRRTRSARRSTSASSPRATSSTSRARRRARDLPARSSATTSTAVRRRTARITIASLAAIGPGTTPGRVYRGNRMSGHMGDERVTVKKLQVVRADLERNLLLVKGSVPGAPHALVLVKKA